ncbi:Uu.00g137430.m01.CDS01 [Anthostomella pinea]|uniref:D-xylose 1-dehydrogenase (NADP(+), D-xylono-1,5-lactone-forming) n=1 Tax=Anthostomella pinea TaxID=933095 RepID=A0AAI8YL29_9PEZI|nr:Uu.00g137430.m01.CDS01 [Anthostomella pinea]
MLSLLNRFYTSFSPPMAEKKNNAIKFGILGAAKIAPMAMINPAKSHPEVVVQAIAARDRARAEEFAKKHGVPDVRDTYQEIIDDPNIDAVFIPLPNGLHYEWATEANLLFNLPELSPSTSQPNPPVLLEAFHNRFHPALHKFLTFVTPADVVHVHTDSMVPWWFTAKDDLEFNYKLGGGSIMALGTYNFAVLRMIFGGEPEECLTCDTSVFGDGIHDQCDYTFKAQFRFPNGIGETTSTLRGSILWKPSEARVTHKEVVVPDKTLPGDQEKVRTRQVTLHGFMHAILWHRIDVKDTYVVRHMADGRPIKKWVESSSHKAYTHKDAGGEFADLPSEDWWISYRHQLEAFVNRIKGRKAHYWVTGEDSIKQMRMVDMAYEKSGLGLRPTSSFR